MSAFNLLTSGQIYGESYSVVDTQPLDKRSLEVVSSCVVEPRVNKQTGEVYEGKQLAFVLVTGGTIYHQIDKNKQCEIGQVVDKEGVKILTLRKPSTNETAIRVTW